MDQKVCAYCGKVLEGKKRRNKYCCGECMAKDYSRRKMGVKRVVVDEDFPWKKIGGYFYECRYNEGCQCRNRQCDTCGWNPAVENARKAKVMV